MDESHVQHLICLIEDKVRQKPQVNKALLMQIQESTWSSDQIVYTLFQLIHLWVLTDTAKNHRCAQSCTLAVALGIFPYLECQLAGGSHDQSLDFSCFERFSLEQMLNNRNGKGSCFPRTGLCGAQ